MRPSWSSSHMLRSRTVTPISRPCSPCSAHGKVPSNAQCRRATRDQAEVRAESTFSAPLKKPVWIDCDPGHDDAIALMLACTHPSLQVLGVSTVACNQSVDKTTINALAVLHAIGHQDVKVHRGQAKPLVQGNVHCAAIHGDSGLDGLAGGRIFPESPHGPHPEKAVIAIAEQIRSLETDGRLPLQLICTGSLTNAALLLTVFPEFSSEKYINITLMGGALGTGNTGPVQEFNIMTDPHAASIVFNSGAPATMVPIEVTHTVLASPQIVETIACLQSPFSERVVDLIRFFADTYESVFQFESPPIHDAVAVAYVIAPHIFVTTRLRVDVELCSSLSRGQTICDVWRQSGRQENVVVAHRVEVGDCWDLILDAIECCNRTSPLNR